MVYEVKASKGKLPINRWKFKLNGQVFDVPKMEFLTGRALLIADKLSQIDEDNVDISDGTLIFQLFEAVAPKASDAIWDSEPEQLMDLFQAWSEASAEPGKSDSSETSSKSTRTRSKRTSSNEDSV